MITLPLQTILMFGNGIGLVVVLLLHISAWQFAAQFSYHCKPVIFQHYVKCDTSRQKWRKWREKCTGINHDLTHFKGS